jgi:hypothetical protein
MRQLFPDIKIKKTNLVALKLIFLKHTFIIASHTIFNFKKKKCKFCPILKTPIVIELKTII